MTIHDKIAVAVQPFIGKTLSTTEVQALVLKQFPGTNPTSIIPSDHSGPNPRSGRSYCGCSGKTFQVFLRENGGYRVRGGADAVPRASSPFRPTAYAHNAATPLPAREKVVIDDAFIKAWEPKYDWIENDEPEYRRLLTAVSLDIAASGTISKQTFLGIWNWKGAMRVIRHVLTDQYDSLYAPVFRRAAAEVPHRKLAALLGAGVKLPGVEAATGSTILHFMHPDTMPIIDVRTIEVLYNAGLISTAQKDLTHYEEFRQAIDGIRRRCPKWTLRQIDRALFAYHKQFLEKGGSGQWSR